MQDHVADPELYSHIRVLISLIVGLGMTRLLTGVARIIQHPQGTPVSWMHLGWVLWMFLALLNFWWWEFRLGHLQDWKFVYYVYVIAYATTYFLLCVLLFPDQMQEYAGFRDYFLSRRAWFFGLLALLFALDIGDTLLKGRAYFDSLGLEYPLRNGTHIVLCIIAMRSANARFHAALVVLALAYQLSWILRLYETLA